MFWDSALGLGMEKCKKDFPGPSRTKARSLHCAFESQGETDVRITTSQDLGGRPENSCSFRVLYSTRTIWLRFSWGCNETSYNSG